MARVVKGRLLLQDRALRVHPYRDARVFGRAGAGSLAACLGLAGAGIALPPPAGVLAGLFAASAAMLAVGLCVAGAAVWLLAAWGAARQRASVRVSDALYLELEGRRRAIPLPAVRGALLRRGGRALTLTTDEGLVLTLALAEPAEARRLLDAIAEGSPAAAWRARVYLPAPPRLRKALAVAFAAAVALLAGALADGAVALAASALAGITFWVLAEIAGWPCRRAELVVGNDGVALRRAGRERFLPLASIAGVVATEHGLALALAGGERLDLDLLPPALRRPALAEADPALDRDPRADPAPEAARPRLLGWLRGRAPQPLSGHLAAGRRARALHLLRERLGIAGGAGVERVARSGGSTAAALLERRGRALPVWQETLRALVRQAGGGYRVAALSSDQALEVLQDGRAPVEVRIGAAMALSTGDDRAATRRLRAAIAACASEEVRAALEQAAEGELEEATLARARLAAGEPR